MASFHSLPLELVHIVFGYVRSTRDLKNSTLVSRAWYDYASKDLWHTFSSDFRETPARSQDALLRCGSAPLRLVKRVILRGVEEPSESMPHSRVEENLISFLTSMSGTSTQQRRGPLVEFSSERPITRSAFRTIVMSHQQLEVCRTAFAIRDDAHRCLSRQHWLGGYFESLTALQINIPQGNNKGRIKSLWDSYRFIIKLAKKLHTLELQSPVHDQAVIAHTLSALGAPIQEALTMRVPEKFSKRNMLNLAELSLKYINLEGKTTLMAEINFLQLRTLRMKSCVGVAALLQATAALFATRAQPRLEHFEFGDYGSGCIIHGEKQAVTQAVEALVNSFAGLRVLHLDTNMIGHPNPQAIIRHARTLTSLSVGSGSNQDFYAWDELATILQSCHELQELGTPLGEECDTMSKWHKRGKTYLSPPRPGNARNTIEGMLSAIGSCQNHKLRVLRLIDAPEMSYGVNDEGPDTNTKTLAAQAAFRGFADHVFRFLHERGSKIDLFVIQKFNREVWADEREHNVDGNGHKYPYYAYMKCESHNRLGTPSIVAVPVRDAEKMFPQVKLFDHTLKYEF